MSAENIRARTAVIVVVVCVAMIGTCSYFVSTSKGGGGEFIDVEVSATDDIGNFVADGGPGGSCVVYALDRFGNHIGSGVFDDIEPDERWGGHVQVDESVWGFSASCDG